MPQYPIATIRHTLAHVMAAAIRQLYPETKFGIGPVIDTGFYYDFDVPHKFSEGDFAEIERRMRALIAGALPVEQLHWPIGDAINAMRDAGQPYKVELLKEIERGERPAVAAEDIEQQKDGKISFYTIGLPGQGEFTDLCKGPHVSNTKELPADGFTLTHVAGAYWRGSEKNPQLQRIYAAAFATQKELQEYLTMVREAKKYDHRKLGKELELFTIVDEIGPGLPLFYPKGALLRRLVEDFIGDLQEARGYTPIWIPHVTKGELYKISGHLDKYDAMYPPMELKGEGAYYIKPMNCPHTMMLYKSLPHSYRELPLRYAVTTSVYRYEKSGELSGLTRVRAVTQDDCHIFMRPDQIEQEMNLILDMVQETYAAFRFKDFSVRVSTHDPKNQDKYIGDKNVWKESEAILLKLIKDRRWQHEIGVGEAAFYGPKLDFIAKDVLGRPWQLSTVQLDMNIPKRFGLEYTDGDGSKKQPVVIHRAILGSTERFLGILIEHFKGAFPAWLSPVQVAVLPITDKQNAYAQKVHDELKEASFRTELNADNESIGKKIRQAELMKVPYLLIIGEKEAKAKKIAVRKRGEGDIGQTTLKKFSAQLQKEVATKA